MLDRDSTPPGNSRRWASIRPPTRSGGGVLPGAAAKDVHSVLSLPLSVNGRGLGALNFYARAKGAFSGDDEEVAGLFARQAAVSLANSSAYWGATALVDQLTEALTSRAVIDQARGVIMGVQGCTADDAFDVLRRASQRENKKVRDFAHGIVERAHRRPNGNDRAPVGPAGR
ncbi:MAG TPA: GAF and ANTAR domain-containing protein [Acidimicrobiales bacterium]|nr:GAF and ANTAR domain-containing protein [Acidimicrobiales bacterium]